MQKKHIHIERHIPKQKTTKSETIIYINKRPVRLKKKMPTLSNIRQKKKSPIPLCSFWVGQLLLGMGPVFECSFVPSETPLEKNKFSFESCCQLEIMSTSPSQCWDAIWLGTMQTLCILPQALCVHMCISPVISKRYCFLFHPPGSYSLSTLSSANTLHLIFSTTNK